VSGPGLTLVGFDTALATTSACVLRSDGAAFRSDPPSPQRLLGPAHHSQELLPELERLLERAGTGWGEVDSIAVGVGPGTFTGLRIGIATARALAQALDVGVRGVSSLVALATGAAAGAELEPGRLVLATIDARRGQVFASLHRVARPPELGLETVWEPFVTDPEPLLARVSELGETLVCAGDWALESAAKLERIDAMVLPPESGLHAVDALQVCRLALGIEPVSASDIFPVYLRLPDAEVNKQLTEMGRRTAEGK
jgi:tRNA threonylcarbamoyladenosine biosynthesis protein TsaB